MKPMRVTRSQTNRNRPASPKFNAMEMQAPDAEMKQEESSEMHGCENSEDSEDDRPMPLTSLVFPGFIFNDFFELAGKL